MLPIHQVIAPLKSALQTANTAILAAPPGAGKTTVVPLALMDEPWTAGGKIIMLEPRRLAARAAAARMAKTLDEAVGDRVGFRVRLQTRVSARTRIEVVTEGVFGRMILEDPGLEGVAAVIFDEHHERSLDGDLGLAFARDAQSILRPDLRILVMSATLDVVRLSRLLADPPVIQSEGRAYPVSTRYLGFDPATRLEEQVVKAVLRALMEEDGGVLVFLPGQGEIRRVASLLADRLPQGVVAAPLYGALGAEEQDQAIAPAAPGWRKVVLATSIAETSLTIDGVQVVVDAGLARVPRYEAASGLTRLQTVRVSRAAADQRRGRAGRTGPGCCYRLWEEAQTRGLALFAEPEILQSDLSKLALDLAIWGADPQRLSFLDPPPTGPYEEAVSLLKTLGALDDLGRVTPEGRRLASFSLPPRLAHLVIESARLGLGRRGGRIAAVLTERGLGGDSLDLSERLAGFDRERSARARDASALAAGWTRQAGQEGGADVGASDGRLLLAAFPERLAQARGREGLYKLASGRGIHLTPSDPLARQRWIVAADLGGGEARDRVLLAARIEEAELLSVLAGQIVLLDEVEAGPTGTLRGRRRRRIGALVIDETTIPVDGRLLSGRLFDQIKLGGVSMLPWPQDLLALRARVAFMRAMEGEVWPDLSDAGLSVTLDHWLPEVLVDARSLQEIPRSALESILAAALPWDMTRKLDVVAPVRFQAPTGSSHWIDYTAEGGPTVEIRVQELFGLAVHPTVASGRTALTLSLTSPARRPIQVTRDLPGFWRGSWSDVRKEMRGRYPRHPWPDDPATAPPTARAKPRGT